MSKDDYEAISKIIEEVAGKDTLTGIKLMEGIEFYFNNKIETIKIVKENIIKPITINSNSEYKKEADKAMKRYTAQLNKENKKLRDSGKHCGIQE